MGSLSPIPPLHFMEYAYDTSRTVDIPPPCQSGGVISQQSGGPYVEQAEFRCIAGILGAHNVNIALPHNRFNHGILHFHFENSGGVAVNRKRNSFKCMIGTAKEHCICIGNERTTDAQGRHLRGFDFNRDAWSAGKGDSVTNGSSGRLEAAWIRPANQDLRVRWKNDCTSICSTYELDRVFITVHLFEFSEVI